MAKQGETTVTRRRSKPTRISVGDYREVIIGGLKWVFALAVSPVEPLTSSTLALNGLADVWKGLRTQKGLGAEAFKVFIEAYLQALGTALAKHGGYGGDRAERIEEVGRKALSAVEGEYDLTDLLQQDLGDFALVGDLQVRARRVLLDLGLEPHLVANLQEDVRRSFELAFGQSLWRLRKSAATFHSWFHEVLLPGRRPAAVLSHLERHAEALRAELVRPLSMARGQAWSAAFNLANLYVEPFLSLEDGERRSLHASLKAILAALDQPRPIIVHGQPGQGKTSLVKTLAARLLTERPDLLCLYVPFAQIPAQTPFLTFLQDQIGPWVTLELLRSNRVLLLADGLDEAQVVAGRSSFLDIFLAVQSLADRVNAGETVRLTTLYTGRSTFIQTYRQVFPADSFFLRIEDFVGQQQEDWCRRFGSVTRSSGPDLARLRRLGFDEFLGQPVLLSLLSLMDLEDGLIEARPEKSSRLNRAALYERIVAWTYHRRWSDSAVNSLAYFVDSPDRYFEILELIAWAIFRRGGRSIEEAVLTFELEGEPQVYRSLGEISLRDFLRRVRISFHFEAREGSAYELVHKSIEDYLVARKVVREARELLSFADRYDRYAESVILPGLHRLSCNRAIDREHALFLRQLLGRFGPADLTTLRNLLQRVWRRMSEDLFLGAEEQLLPGVSRLDGAINTCLTVLHLLLESHRALEDVRSDRELEWLDLLVDDRDRLGRMVDLCDASWPSRFAAAGLSFRHCDLSGARLQGKALDGADFAGAALPHTDLKRSSLANADFRDADLSGADLRGCDLSGANLTGANVEGMLLAGARREGLLVDWRKPPRRLPSDWQNKPREKVVKTAPRALAVDDEEVLRDVFADLLPKSGIEVTCVATGEEALAQLRGLSYDVVLLDLFLPGLTGQQVLAEIRETEPDLPVIVITAWSSIESAKEMIQAGAFDYIPKPFKIEELLRAVAKALTVRMGLGEAPPTVG